MKGLEESEKFYIVYGAEMIEREFGEYAPRIAVGLAGHGSECFGYDDDISRDHDFEVGFCMWLTAEDEAKIGFKLTRAYDKLRADLGLTSAARLSVGGYNSGGVQTIGDFYRRYTGCDGAPNDLRSWLYTDSEYFAEATNGKVFRDDLGTFSRIREEILHGMPEDVRLKKLAAAILRMAQTGQYNYARCLAHKEEGAAAFALCQFVKDACNAFFLLDRRHAPYYKWIFRALRETRFGEYADALEFMLTSENDEAGIKVKSEMIEDIAHAVITELKAQELADKQGNYLEPFAYALQKKIKSAQIRNLHILVG